MGNSCRSLTNSSRDIIDHEKYSVQGDVRKMLLGSFVPSIDNSEMQSPTRTNSMMTSATGSSSNRNSVVGGASPAFPSPMGMGAFTNLSAIGEELPSSQHMGHIRVPSDGTHSSAYRTPPETPSNKFWRRSNG